MKTVTKLEVMPEMPRRKRVVAYARVSSGKDEMLESLSAQISYYSGYIQNHSGWEYAGVFADEALTGTKDTRPEFQRLLSDCRSGKIDIVLTKSISRFARNTVILLETVRELKSLNVDVWFTRENIRSMSSDGELLITILAGYAQEESRSVSENCKWRIRKDFSEGRASSTTMFGYKPVDGTFVIIPEEAEVVRMIFADHLGGMGKNAIMKKLIDLEIPTKFGGKWSESQIGGILSNEKYTGDMLLQKVFRKDHITKKTCINKGELPQYFVENSHQGIIDRDTFAKVQAEMERRASTQKTPKSSEETYPFTSKIVCSQCGKNYRRKITAAGTPYEKAVWICSTYNKYGKKACPSQQIPEDILLEIAPAEFEKIIVPEAYTILIVLPDGTKILRKWEHESRSRSWTPSKKEAARERQLKIIEERRRDD